MHCFFPLIRGFGILLLLASAAGHAAAPRAALAPEVQAFVEQMVERHGFERETLVQLGQQVKKGYLSVLPLPGGSVRYSVTPRAVRELGLGQEGPEGLEERDALAKLSEASFAEEWDSPEDSIYDEL